MKTLLLVLLCCIPSIVGGANYSRIANEARIIENKDGKITVIERSIRFKKLYYFIKSHPKAENPLYITEIIYACDYPEVMAGIASVESGFDSNAVGPCQEVSAFQILEWEIGDPKNINDGLNNALDVFKEKLAENKTIPKAIKGYNGSGPKAEIYKRLVLKKINQIKSMKV